MANDHVTRLNIKTGEMIDYLLPHETNIRRVDVDKSVAPSQLWFGNNHKATLVKVEPLDQLGDGLRGIADPEELVAAARWHDAGKAHPAFQAMLTARLPDGDPRRDGGPWAKSDLKHSGRNRRRFFRHELASALTWLAETGKDLGAYLIAAHHGKVRTALRARPGEEPPPTPGARCAHGVHDGDEVPVTDLGSGVQVPAQRLSLACMELGGGGNEPSWADRTQRLLDQLGPFRLAYLEMLVRVADWRASAKRAVIASAVATGSAP
jgi:CRISPR-associated endonuclease/helicase Cas3